MRSHFFHTKANKGVSLVEIVIGSAIISVGFIAIVGAYNLYLTTAIRNTKTIQATFLVEETFEALNLLRDISWTSKIAPLTSGTTYYLSFDGTNWNTSSTNTYIDGVLERKFSLENVYRNASGAIVTSGTLDTSTKKVNATTTWAVGNASTTRAASMYLHNLFLN